MTTPVVYTAPQLLQMGISVATYAFSETLTFLIAAFIVLTFALLIGAIVVRSLTPTPFNTKDDTFRPFTAFRITDAQGHALQTLPTLASIFVTLVMGIQVFKTFWEFWWVGGGHYSLADVALTNMVACLGMEAACAVVFLGVSWLLNLGRVAEMAVEGEGEGRKRSRSRRAE